MGTVNTSRTGYIPTGSGGGAGSGDVTGPSGATASDIVIFSGTTGKVIADSGKALSTDGTMAANSDAKVPTEKAIVTYVAALVTGLLDFKGSTDCSTNPNYPAASKGDAYVVSVAGKIGGASGTTVEVGDVYFAIADNAGGTEASVGASWDTLQHNLVGALLSANNLSDVASVATASANLQGTGLTDALVGFRNIPQNSQSAAYTTVAADSGKHILHPSGDANARTFTIDSNANVPYPVGTAITFVNETSQVVSIAIASDTLTLAGSTTTGTRALAQNGVATALKVTTTKWVISGTGVT